LSTEWHVAQINVARLLKPQADREMREFFALFDGVNEVADETPGFVWRLKGEEGPGATSIQATVDPLLIVNLTLWEDTESLFDFVYRSAHTPVMAKRKQWIDRFEGAYQALWWVPAGTVPTVNDGLSRLWHLDRFGPTPLAFTFKARFPEPGLVGPPIDMRPDPWCVGTA
jgi:hypothetical protein